MTVNLLLTHTNRAARLVAGLALTAAALVLSTTLSAAPAAAAGPFAVVCRDPNFTGVCQTVTSDIPDLNGSAVGDNTVTSVGVPAGAVLVLYQHPNYQGECQEFDVNDPWLPWSIVGDDTASSLKVRTFHGTCGNMTIQTPMRGINHFETFTGDYFCPWHHQYVSLRLWNASSPGVSVAAGEVTQSWLSVTYTNWNLTGDQAAGIKMTCSNDPGLG